MPNKKISGFGAITTLVGADLFEVSQHVSGSTYTSKKISVTDMLTVFAGVTDHGALTGLGDNDHPQYLLVSAVNDTIEAAIANAPTGTGSVVLSASPTFTGTVGAAAITTTGSVTVGDRLLLANGSESLPSLSFTNDPNTGLYGGGGDILRFVTGGTERLLVSSSGFFYRASPTLSSTLVFGWEPGVSGVASIDAAVSRLGAASLAIGNGTAGDYSGTLRLTSLNCPTIAPSGGATSITGTLTTSSYVKMLGSANQNDAILKFNASDNTGFSDRGAGNNTVGFVGGGSAMLNFDGNNGSLTAYAAIKIGFSSAAAGSGWAGAPDAYWTRAAAGSISQHYDASNKVTHTVSSGGNLTIAPSGGATSITGTLNVSSRIAIGTGTAPTDFPLEITADAGGDGFIVYGSAGNLQFKAGGTNGGALISVSNTSTNGFVIGTDGGGNAAGRVLRLRTNDTDRIVITSTGATSIAGDTSITGTLAATVADAVTNAVTNVLTIGHNTSGTAAAGFGSSLKFQLESSTTADVDCASLQALWDTATHASRKGSFVLTVFNGSTEKTTLKGVTTADNERIEVPIGSTATSGAGLAFIGSGGAFGWERSGDGSWNFFSFGSIHVNVGNGRLDGSGTGICISSQSAYGFSSVSSGNGLQTVDATICRSMANGLVFGPGSTGAGSATSRNCVNKAVASIADNTATTVFTVTIPNAAHSASIRVRLVGSSGAGGAVGANESTQEAEYLINLCRTAGVNAVAAIGAVIGQPAAATVAGGNAVAVSGTISAISGAVGASNTFTIQVTIARTGGSATNHTCLAFAELLNANATGVTIA